MADIIKRIQDESGAVRDDAAVGIEFAEDYMEKEGIRFYYATVAHKWILMKLSGKQFKHLDDFDKATVMAYCLAHKMPDHLTELSAQMRKATIFEKALDFFIKKNISPEILAGINELMLHPYSDAEGENPTSPAPSTSTGGADLSTDLP